MLSGCADLVAEVLDTLGIDEPVSVMGNSMGAAVPASVAMQVAMRPIPTARGCSVCRASRARCSELRSVRLDRLRPDLQAPVLQVWGKHDRLVPSRHSARTAGAIVLPGRGHCPQLDAPDLLLDAVLPFLDARGAARTGPMSRAAGS